MDQDVSRPLDRIAFLLRHGLGEHGVDEMARRNEMGRRVSRAVDHPHLGGPEGRVTENPMIFAVTLIQRPVHVIDVQIDGAIEDAGNVVVLEKGVVAGRHLIADIKDDSAGTDVLGDGVHGNMTF